ncbi:MAG: hypothetical protein ABSE67_08455 [Xanthobacteraceae bacterium]
MTARRLLGLTASALIVGGAIAACRPTGDIGYVEIKTVPVAPVTQTALYIDAAKLAPIKKGGAILRQPIGTLKLQADGLAGSLTPLCDIVVKRNRITTVTISVLERPPRCQCRYSGSDAAHACVS